QNRTNALLRKGCERRFEIAISSGILNNELQAQRARRRLQVYDDRLGRWKGRVDETPNRAAVCIKSRSNCNRFGPNSAAKFEMPVRFAPGRLRLATRPNVTGSPAVLKTIGMVVVAVLAASTAGVSLATITATRRRTRSAASAASRSY